MEQKEKEIKNGIADFKSRLRAMYVSGAESYTQVLLESEDFYDILMRFELVKRVAKHDNDTIDKLLELKKQYENEQKKYQEQKKQMEETAQKYAKQLSNLSKEQSNLETLKAESEANAANIQSQNEELNNQRSQVSSKKAQAEYNATTTTTTTTTTQAATAYRPSQNNYSNRGSSGNSSSGYSGSSGNSGNSGSGYSGDIGTVISYAKSMVGGSYVWGGSSYRATDCSGLVMLSYAQVGISLPHNAAAQAGYGKSVSYDSMQPGDLIFFGASIYHVAMYIGDGMMVHAENSSTGIVISYVSSFSQYNPISAIKRIIY